MPAAPRPSGEAYGVGREVKLARGPLEAGSGAWPAKTQSSTTIVAIAASTVNERRASFVAAIAITKTKIRTVQVISPSIAVRLD